ncbi:lipase family protein [Rhodococcus chondri]|uniref:Lipase family protein n=1 Tax=Rhodococcus chondri TaxID=3065941 RepID=A0ABU7JZ87_9NOCA|nr:lipase family protein [Rhodococcus sp. CC-R104]MEE2035291.1 lipase family protein [Rhodococcus sp. CC-R104]
MRAVARCLVFAAVAALSVAAGVTASAQPPAAPAYDDFYSPPSPLPSGAPGDVLRTEPAVAAIIPNTPAAIDAAVTRVMYRSESATGTPTAVVGTVLEPTLPWHGPGLRPTVVVGPGTQGMGDQCAPSKLMMFGQEYEYLQIGPLLAHGYTVAVTDYEGLGTPGDHPYLNRLSQGHAMLDLARATRALPGIDAAAPIAFWGYSQGGMSAAAAAELKDSYAPELPVVAAVAGSPPASLADLAVAGDGSLLSGGIGWVVNGFVAAYPQHADRLRATFSPAGHDILHRAAHSCTYDAPLLNPFFPTTAYTVDGRPIAEHLVEEPWASLVSEQELGNRAPSMPVFVAQSTGDDFVLVRGVDTMVGKWCAAGAAVNYQRYDVPPVLTKTGAGHGAGLLPALVQGLEWLDERFAGVPDAGSCNL